MRTFHGFCTIATFQYFLHLSHFSFSSYSPSFFPPCTRCCRSPIHTLAVRPEHYFAQRIIHTHKHTRIHNTWCIIFFLFSAIRMSPENNFTMFVINNISVYVRGMIFLFYYYYRIFTLRLSPKC